jgi:hypothetical protein
MKKQWISILYFGAIWGIAEATLGYVLHFVPVLISGSIMFPIAGFILYHAYQKLESRKALMMISVVTVVIKSVNLFMPQPTIFKAINPMVAILLEAAFVVLIIPFLDQKSLPKQYAAFPIASIGWRSVFIGFMALQFVVTGNLAPYITTIAGITNFILIVGLVSGLIGSLFVFVNKHVSIKLPDISNSLVFTSIALIIAVVTTVIQ